MIDPETSQAIQKQMLEKMEHYRGILREASRVLRGDSNAIGFYELRMKIEKELSLNPEWEVLENLPHGIPMCQDPNIYKEIDQ